MLMRCMNDLGNRIFLLWSRKLGSVAFTEFKPALRIVTEPLLATRPKPIYKDTKAVSPLGLLIRSFQHNLHGQDNLKRA